MCGSFLDVLNRPGPGKTPCFFVFYSSEGLVYHNEMRYYPILLNMSDKRCLVVGAGRVGVRKIKGLLDGGVGHVLVVDIADSSNELNELLVHPALSFEQRAFCEQDLTDCLLVFACTSSAATNRRIGDLCRERGLLCNIADQPDDCSFILPATVQRGDLLLTVSTCGQSPAFSRKVRKELEDYFGSEYALLLVLMGRIRPLLLALGKPTLDNTTIFRALVASNLLKYFETKDVEAIKDCLIALLPQELHPNLPELLDGIV